MHAAGSQRCLSERLHLQRSARRSLRLAKECANLSTNAAFERCVVEDDHESETEREREREREREEGGGEKEGERGRGGEGGREGERERDRQIETLLFGERDTLESTWDLCRRFTCAQVAIGKQGGWGGGKRAYEARATLRGNERVGRH